MSCVKGVSNTDPNQWQAAATPLPTMMGLERRGGKDKPVITKALTELNGDNFLAYKSVRERWALLDPYLNVGPIQFSGPETNYIPFLVKAPTIEQLKKETDAIEASEAEGQNSFSFHTPETTSQLSATRQTDPIAIPDIMKEQDLTIHAIRKYNASTLISKEKIGEQFPLLNQTDEPTYFCEVIQRKNCPKDFQIHQDAKELENRLKNFNS